jgi:hypothetical protein
MRMCRPAVGDWLKVCCVVLFMAGCAPLISEYSLDAYKNATSLKAETLALIDKAGEKYASHKDEAEALTTKINAAYEFAAGLSDNSQSAQQWQLLRNPDGGLYGGFIRIWKAGPLPPVFRDDKKIQIGRAFDEIICLEINKKETQRCTGAAAAAPKS